MNSKECGKADGQQVHKYQHKVLIVSLCLVVIAESRHSQTVEDFLCRDSGSCCDAGSYETGASGVIVKFKSLAHVLLAAQSKLMPNC